LHDFLPEEVSGELEILAADDDDLCSAQNLLGDDRSQTAQEMATAIDDESLKRGEILMSELL
jgi:hypothetical protein